MSGKITNGNVLFVVTMLYTFTSCQNGCNVQEISNRFDRIEALQKSFKCPTPPSAPVAAEPAASKILTEYDHWVALSHRCEATDDDFVNEMSPEDWCETFIGTDDKPPGTCARELHESRYKKCKECVEVKGFKLSCIKECAGAKMHGFMGMDDMPASWRRPCARPEILRDLP